MSKRQQIVEFSSTARNCNWKNGECDYLISEGGNLVLCTLNGEQLSYGPTVSTDSGTYTAILRCAKCLNAEREAVELKQAKMKEEIK